MISQETIQCLVKECEKTKDLKDGRKIVNLMASHGLDSITDLHDYLIRMFTSCGSLKDANLMFRKVEKPTLYTWNSIMSAHASLGDGKGTIALFYELQEEGFKPSKFIFLSVLKSIGKLKSLPEGRDAHSRLIRRGFENDIVIGSSLIDMYGKCGSISEAHRVFETLPNKNVVSWNAMIAGYVQQKQKANAFGLFMKLQREGIQPTKFTLSCILKACDNIEQCVKIHDQVLVSALGSDIVVGTALIDTYAKCGGLDHAHKVFDRLVEPDLASWNAIISGYAQHGHGLPALKMFEKMLDKVKPDKMTFSSALKAIGSIGAIKNGRLIYHQAIVNCLEGDLILSNTLIDMYAKCGSLRKAHEVFERLPIRNVVTWNAIIAGYAQIGMVNTVFLTFDKMIGENIIPNQVTFLSVLTACSHAGLVARGQMFFEIMSQNFGISSSLAHQTCMIDLLGRAGQLDKAMETIEKMRFHGDLVMWLTLLGACKKWSNLQIGEEAFGNALQLDAIGSAAYVCMYNMYSHIDVLEDV